MFDKINASKLNDYLKEMMEDLSAKVFRTYNASVTLQNELYGKDIEEQEKLDQKVQFYTDCNREVARLCNHQKAVAKNFNEQMDNMRIKLVEKQDKLKVLETHLQKLKKNKGNNNPKMPKTVEQCAA